MLNYQLEMEKMLAKVVPGTPLLLHACCAPCATSVLGRLENTFAVTIYFYNPNFDTEEEYHRRKQAMEQLLERRPAGQYPVKAIYPAYEPEPFLQGVQGLEGAPEGGARCTACFGLRLGQTAHTAKERGFEWFGTTLSVSPHKNAALLNEMGQSIGHRQGLQFLPADFKKRDGYRESVRLSQQYGLYRQDYCGCAFAKAEG